MHDRNDCTAARAALAVILTALFATTACGSSGGRPSGTGGAGTAGAGGAAGAAGAGGGGGMGGMKDGGAAAGADAQPSGSAVIKFCNGLALANNMPFTLVLDVGDPPIELTAGSGECSSAVGVACKVVPAGEQTVTLMDDQQQMLPQGMATFADGEQWVLVATLDAMKKPTLKGGALAQSTCSEFTPFVMPDGGTMLPPPPADPGAPDTGVAHKDAATRF